MADVNELASQLLTKASQVNPANAPAKTAAERVRIPMTAPMRKLEVSSIPGYHLQWIRGTADRMAQAKRAGYTFVTEDEVSLNSTGLGDDGLKSGSTDMGSGVSTIEGGEAGPDGQPVRLHLMKQRIEDYLEDQKVVQDRNDNVARALTAAFMGGHVGGQAPGEKPEDMQNRYVDRKRMVVPEMFRKKTPKPS